MENNTITPNPEPKPQPVAPMPVFGVTATPAPAPATPLPTSTLPDMSPAPAASAAGAPAPTPAAPTPAAPAPVPPAAPAPVTPASVIPPAAPAPSPAPAAAPAPTAPIPVPTPAPAPTPAPVTAPAATTTPTATTSPSPAPVSPATPAPESTTTATPAPINKGRLAILIAIIAGLLVAGIIAAILIVLLISGQPDPAAKAEAALSQLADPAGAPTNITGSVELVNNDDVIASASVVLEESNLFLTYDGVSSILESYLGLASVADQESVSSLVVISSLVQFAENTWWQIPVEDLTIASAYRAHPFLVLASVNNNEYHLKIDSGRFADFLTELDLDFSATAETNCIDGPSGTNCGSSDSAGLSLFGITSMPTASQVKETATSIDILATIDTQNRITSMYAVLGEDDFVVNVKLNLVYAGASLSPEEYRPISELMSQFLRTIGY